MAIWGRGTKVPRPPDLLPQIALQGFNIAPPGLNELKSRFIDLAYHEFRNPLASILLTIELLQLDDNPAQQEYLYFIKQAAKQMQFLLEDILVLGKAEGGKLVFKPVPLNLEHFCGKLVEQMELTVLQLVWTRKRNFYSCF